MGALDSLSSDDKRKLDNFYEAGKRYLQEIDDNRGSLRDLAKALAEEFGVKPKILLKAVRTIYKDDLAAQQEDMDTLNDLLVNTGHG